MFLLQVYCIRDCTSPRPISGDFWWQCPSHEKCHSGRLPRRRMLVEETIYTLTDRHRYAFYAPFKMFKYGFMFPGKPWIFPCLCWLISGSISSSPVPCYWRLRSHKRSFGRCDLLGRGDPVAGCEELSKWRTTGVVPARCSMKRSKH